MELVDRDRTWLEDIGWIRAPKREQPRPRACACRQYCGDVSEADDPDGTCKALPRAPEPPLVEIILVHRDSVR